jgi:hypothetical protein
MIESPQHSEAYIKAGFRQLQCTKAHTTRLHLVVSLVLTNDYIRLYSINPCHVHLSVTLVPILYFSIMARTNDSTKTTKGSVKAYIIRLL